jgi:Flp pilus assembly pilin Flp
MEKTMDTATTKPAPASLLADTRGLTTVEYIILLCLVAVVGFGVWQKFGASVRDKVSGATTQVESLPQAPEESP